MVFSLRDSAAVWEGYTAAFSGLMPEGRSLGICWDAV